METISLEFDIEIIKESRINDVDWDEIGFGKIYSDHMFISDYIDGQWLNNKIIPFQDMPVSPATAVIHYGQSIFEGMKAYLGPDNKPRLFRPHKNLYRFNLSAKRMGMPEIPEDIFMKAIEDIVTIDKDWIPQKSGSSLYIRPFMCATDRFIGVKPADTFRFFIITCPVDAYYSKPVNVLIADEYVRAFKGGVGEAKTAGNYAATMLPVLEAKKKGYDQILWMDGIEFKYVQEIGTMNVFFVIDGKVLTPKLNGAILQGITRDSVIQLLRDKNIPCEIRDISIDEISQAYSEGKLEDAFGTGTAATIAHISSFGYKDKVIKLPEVGERIISNSLKEELQMIKNGKTKDIHNWVHNF
jgi:branched-chain amino acid aminotransferase